MRKLFLGITTLSMLGALIVGAALAWTTQVNNTTGSAQAGQIVAEPVLTSVTPAQKLYPTGTYIHVQDAALKNTTPADPGISLKIASGTVFGFPTTVANGYGTCNVAGMLSGIVDNIDSTPVAPGSTGGSAAVQIKMDPATPECAENKTFGYTVQLTMVTN
jgi:hypothetical protein